MNENKLRRLFPNASKNFLMRNSDSHIESGASPIVQEQQEPVQKQENKEAIHSNQPFKETMDGVCYPKYRISIVWLVSDERRRDAWGMAETVADCIVSASRRFLGIHDTRTPGGAKGRKRK